MKTIHYPYKIRSHLVTIVPVAPFTPKATLKLGSALQFRYSISVVSCISSHALFPALILLNPINHHNHGFHNTFDNKYFLYSDF